jgi:hypothetical protein
MKFLAFIERFKVTNLKNFCKIETYKEIGYFLIAFFIPTSLRHAYRYLLEFIRVDNIYTTS